MDAGWYAEGGWWPLVGEWEICEKRFGGEGEIDKVFDKIKEKGMRSGIWLEPEVMGINCPLVPEFEDCFFKHRGENVICEGRYQLDFRKEKVINHLNRVVDNLVNRLGVSYFKFDYNIDPTYGTEVDSDSGEDGLIQAQAAYLKWVDSLYERYPDLIIENCDSGGMRMDWESLKHFALQSVSDALPIFPESICTCEDDWMVGGRITAEDTLYLTVAHMKGESNQRQIEIAKLQNKALSAEILYPVNLGTVSTEGNLLTVNIPEKSAILIKIKV